MGEPLSEGLSPHQEHIAKLRKKVEAGLLDPWQDPETLAEIDNANLGQTETVESSTENPWQALPRSADHDPDSPAHYLPRKPHGQPTNKVVPTQSTLEGGKTPVVLSRTGKTSALKSPQPYEKGRVGQDSPKDQQEANAQRYATREDMRKRGEDV